jgi:hypothetical protein
MDRRRARRRGVGWAATAALSASLVVAIGGPAAAVASVPTRPRGVSLPTVTGPVTGGMGHPTIVSTSFDLGSVGYTGQEYFLSGTAHAFTSAKPLTTNGRWSVRPASTAPYETRILVYQPSNPKKFDGTVFVEWLNTTAGFDTAPDWQSAHNAIIREGAAWIGVSAQSVGVQGGAKAVGGVAAGGLKGSDPVRYAALHHPGDSYSYDIFSQAGLVARQTGKTAPLAGLKVRHVIALGESQSAFRLVTYVNAVQPLNHVFDGFLLHSRGGGGSSLAQAPLAPIPVPAETIIRTDQTVPVLTLETETDLINPEIGYFPAQQPDSSHFRLWEVPGTAHADLYSAGGGFSDTGNGQAEGALFDVGAVTGGPLSCSTPINDGPGYLVVNAAVSHLNQWVQNGTLPPRAPRLETQPGPPVTVARDAHGNALGGIRTPLVDVPIATLRGDGNGGGPLCSLFGSTVPFSAATLAALYPTHAAFVTRFDAAAQRALRAGFLLAPDVKNLEAAAAKAAVN